MADELARPGALERARLQDAALELAERGVAANTRRTYGAGWRVWEAWCRLHELRPSPATAEDVACYLADRHLEGMRPSTLARDLVAISHGHRSAGVPSPTHDPAVLAVLRGCRRDRGVEPRRVHAIDLVDLAQLVRVARAKGGAQGDRDRVLVLLGWGAALRRSELVALDWTDLETTDRGVTIRIRRSKTDQEGQGAVLPIPTARRRELDLSPALEAWRAWRGMWPAGPVLCSVSRHGKLGPRLSDRDVARIVQRLARDAGVEAWVAGHSLRAGYATTAAAEGVQERQIQRVTRHRSLAQLRTYIRHGTIWRDVAELL